MTKVWDEALELQGTPLIVLLCIADHAQDETGEAWPSIARICHRTRRSERSVYEALQVIEDAGWVERVARPGRSNVYRLTDPTPAADRTPAESAPLRETAPTPAVDRTPPLRETAPITIKEPPSESPAAAATATGTPVLEVPVQEAASRDSGQPVTIPMVLQRKLRDMGVVDGATWTTAWQAAVSLEWPEWAQSEADRFPEEHLMLHLLAQQEQGRTPSPSRWMRFYVEDRSRRVAIIAGQMEQEARMAESPQEREDRLNRRLPPVEWGVPAATDTGEQA